MAVSGSKIIQMTASLDVYDSQQKKLLLKGARLYAAVDSTAVLRKNDANGEVIYYLAGLAKTTDESQLDVQIEGGKVHLTLTGAGAEVYLYLE